MWKRHCKKITAIILTAVATMTLQTATMAAPIVDPFAGVGAGSVISAAAPVETSAQVDELEEILTDDDREAFLRTQSEQKIKENTSVSSNSVLRNADETVEQENNTADENITSDETREETVLSAGTGLILEDADEQEDEEEEFSGSAYGYTNLGIVQVEDHLNIRESAEDGSKIVGKMEGDCGCEILSIEGNKAHITSGSVEGYVSTDYLLTGQEALDRAAEVEQLIATVTADGLKLREEPSTEASVLTMVAYGEELQVLEQLDGWVAVKYDGYKVYVSAEYVTIDRKLKTALNISEFLYGQGVSNVRLELCEYAKQFIGNPYVWGGESLTKGADCSGYVLSIYKKYGISLPHSSRAQANCGRSISLAEAKPGDLVFYAKGNRINHVGIYIGGGQIVNASSPKTGIRIANVHYRKPVKVVSLLD